MSRIVSCLVPVSIFLLFGSPAAYATMYPNPTDEIGTVSALVSGDFNGDGRGDAVFMDGSSNLTIVVGIGDGTFAPPALVATGIHQERRMSTVDFDGDGRLDVAVLVYDVDSGHGTNARVLLFRGRGDGSFDPPVANFVANETPIAMATLDFNGDGAPDAVVLTGTLLCRLFNSGTGTLNAPLCQSWTGANVGVEWTVGDFNSDGRPDLAVDESIGSSAGGISVQVLFNNGPTGFSAPVTVVPNGHSGKIASADLNGDGHADLVYTIFPQLSDPNSYIRVQYGDGSGGFSAPISYVGSNCCALLQAADVDNDGRLDIISVGSSGITLHPGLPGGDFGSARILAASEDLLSAALGDLNGDERIDLVAAMNRYSGSGSTGGGSDALRSYLGTPDGRFGMTSLGDGASTDAASADLNGDGYKDLVFLEHNDNRLAVLLSHGDGSFANPLRFPCGSSPHGLALGDFNGDGRVDAVTGLSGSLALLLGNGDGTLSEPLTITGGDLHTQVVTGDFNGDGRLDLASNNQLGADVSVFWNGADGTWDTGRMPAGWHPTALATADLDGDGILDIVSASNPDGNVKLALVTLHGRGDGTFDAPQSLPSWNSISFCKITDVLIADLNGDGIQDLAAPNDIRGGDVSVFFGLGSGAYAPRLSLRAGSTPIALAAADINGDGRVDLVAAYADSADVGIFEADGAGGFLAPQRFGTLTPADLVTGDFNGNGTIDFALATSEAVASVILNRTSIAPGQDPVAEAGPDRSLECGTSFLLDGSGSSDADSTPGTNDDIVQFVWYEHYGQQSQFALGAGQTLTVSLAPGVHTITLKVTDSTGRAANDNVTITVTDTLPPSGSVALTPNALWPPNHRMIGVIAQVTASDQCSAVTVTLESVTSSEPDDAPGGADGGTTGDVAGVSTGTFDTQFSLRAERSSTGPGRVYTVSYRLADGSGNQAVVRGTVIVPHDNSGITDPISLSVSLAAGDAFIQWTPVAGASSYDVVAGLVSTLVNLDPGAGQFAPVCIADQLPPSVTSFQIGGDPAPDTAYFFLVDYVSYADATNGRSGYGSDSGQFDLQPVVPVGLCP
jgi:hypothetical protein